MADKIIIGAGLYGLYAAARCGRQGQEVIVLEQDEEPFMRATYINQARVHMGYHYPRSLSTAMKSAGYFRRFVEDYSFCIHSEFDQVYATSKHFSWTDAAEFRKFCQDASIPCMDMPIDRFFRPGVCDGAFLTREYTYDAMRLKEYLLAEISNYPGVRILCRHQVERVIRRAEEIELCCSTEEGERVFRAPFVLNASYASVNQVLALAENMETECFPLKYELCEIILCKVNHLLEDIGITVMDGPFFSIMPFGKTGLHSLTSVTFTPHKACFEALPKFSCFAEGSCTPRHLGNCNLCPNKPESAWDYMSALAGKYMKESYQFQYEKSLFSMKPILKASEIDDSRPTVIRYASRKPVFLSVLSGKINTIYDLDEFLD